MKASFLSRRIVDASIAGALAVALLSTTYIDRRTAPDDTELPTGGESPQRPAGLLDPVRLYSNRPKPGGPQVVPQVVVDLGATAQSEAAVKAGLEWLARHQAKDGSWCNRHLGAGEQSVCNPDHPCHGPGQDFGVAQTGLAVLAFQAGGHYAFNDWTYSDAVRRGLDWLAAQQTSQGGVYSDSGRNFMYEHGIATFALAEACALARAFKREPDPRHWEATEKAVSYLQDRQHKDGGWRYDTRPSEASDTSVTGWQVLALKSAREAGFPVRDECLQGIRKFFQRCETGKHGRTGYTLGRGPVTDATTGVGMLVHQFLLGDPDCELVRQATPYLASVAGTTRVKKRTAEPDYYFWYNGALAMFIADAPQGSDWSTWNGVVRERLLELQCPADAGCEAGSWPPKDRWGKAGGRIYSTALAVLTLEVYYRFAKTK